MNVLDRDLGEWLERIYRKLLEYDPGIVEIVQFGSPVYAPERARDVDLLVITRCKISEYLNACMCFEAPILRFFLFSQA